jgi:hypothetical protein
MERLSKANLKKADHPLTNKEKYDYLIKKNKNLEILLNVFDLHLTTKK